MEFGLTDNRKQKLRLVGSGISGLLFSILWLCFAPAGPARSVLEKPFDGSKPVWFTLTFKAFHLLSTFPAIQVLFASFLFLSIYRWRDTRAWIYALGAGMTLGVMFFNWSPK